MRKIILPAMLSAVMAFTLCLAGCGSSNNTLDLDQTTTFGGMTYGIGSDWEADIFSEESDQGAVTYEWDEHLIMQVQYQNMNLDETPEDMIQQRSEAEHENFQYHEVSQPTIPGAECTLYKYSYTTTADNGSKNDSERAVAYILRPDMHYSIAVSASGDPVSTLETILDTVSFPEEETTSEEAPVEEAPVEEATVEETPEETEEEAAPEEEAPQDNPDKAASPEPTMGEQNALSKAQSYLDSSAFSYSGLREQLEFEGFSEEEATFGVDNCGADWNEQAAKKAESYLSSFSFSREDLLEQLEYEGFSAEEAEYGVSAVGY